MGAPGAPDAMVCETCRAELPAAARFCHECGAPVAARATRELRKTVTLLFTDVTGSIAMGEKLDPETYRGVMTRYFDVARRAVEHHGGTVEKFVGDAVLAVFGVPEVREDDALRGVRAAHELNRAISMSEELLASVGVGLEVRTGVNTGSVVTGAARAGGSFATGDAVNAAARLEQAAPPGQILIGAETYALVRDAVDAVAVDPVAAKGKAEPLVAYQLLDVFDATTGRSRRTDVRLVGRDREARALDDALERTLESGRGHLVTVLGAAGIGKSRLVSDFLGRVGDRADVLSGRCVSYGRGITFWPVVQLLRQALGLSGGESDEITKYALEHLLDAAPDKAAVTDLLLPMLGKAGEPGGSEQTFWAVGRALEELASRRPLVVTVDDLHWAEPTLLDLIERVRDEVRDLPLLLVCQARPELLDDHPNWGGGSTNSLTFGLEPFSLDQTQASLTALLGGEVPSTVVETVAGLAGGNPLFIEEITTHLLDNGLLHRAEDGWTLTGDLTEAQVPPTVAALLAARLDRLPETELRLVERISVVGLEMSADEAVFLADGAMPAEQVPGALAALGRRDLLHRKRTARGETWAFRHLMVRDAAYESLPKAQRAELHERFADRVEASGDEAGAERLPLRRSPPAAGAGLPARARPTRSGPG